MATPTKKPDPIISSAKFQISCNFVKQDEL